LAEALGTAGLAASSDVFPDVAAAYLRARERAGPDDRILVFGSFHTVGDVLALLKAG
jgi:dihydrofolate synthase / folylpolyglutamate synthase